MSAPEVDTDSWLRVDAKLLVVCMILLGAAAGWLLLTRPVHHIEGDFMAREDRLVSDDWLAEQLENPIAEQRARAYLTLGRVEGRAAVRRLTEALGDPAPSVRAQAAFALGEVLDTRGPNREPDREPDRGPARRPARRPDREAAHGLTGVLLDSDRRVVTHAVEALGKLEWRDAADEITNCAAPIVVIMTALIRMGAHDQGEFITDYLESDDQDSRWAAALAAGQLALAPTPTLDQRITKLLTDRNDFVRSAALQSVGVLYREPGARPPGIIDAVRSSLEHRDIKLRYEAQRALAILQGEILPSPLPTAEPLLPPRQPPSAVEALFEDNEYQPIARTTGGHLVMVTSIGELQLDLDYENAPLTSEYFRRQATAGMLDGTTFQAVSPNGYVVADGRLGWIRPETNPMPFLRGSLGLLRAKNAASAGEFFICLTALPLADSRYVNFGRLVSGDQLIDQIQTDTVIQSIRPAR